MQRQSEGNFLFAFNIYSRSLAMYSKQTQTTPPHACIFMSILGFVAHAQTQIDQLPECEMSTEFSGQCQGIQEVNKKCSPRLISDCAFILLPIRSPPFCTSGPVSSAGPSTALYSVSYSMWWLVACPGCCNRLRGEAWGLP